MSDFLVGLGRRLRTARAQKDLSLDEVQHRAGIDARRLIDIEAGDLEPTLDELVPLARLYDVSLDWMAGRADVCTQGGK